MSPKQIRAAVKKIESEIKRLKGLVKIEQAKWQVAQDQCSHPEAKTYYCMGDHGLHCPDCGLDR